MKDRGSSFLQIAKSVPDYRALLTVEELSASTRTLEAQRDPLVRIQPIGHSRLGEPIELISVGHGARHALLVGTPHPNEPIGCLTIEFLIEHLRKDAALRDELGYTWHFIKTIEPDGLRLNEGWLKRPNDPSAYLTHFFRPAAREQAEYNFPLASSNYRFESSTPENLAWQEAIRICRPDFLFSLHNNEHGGVFYILSHADSGLAAELARQPADFGLPLDTVGESFDESATIAPGVFHAFDIAGMLIASSGNAKSGEAGWQAGQSSFGFCAAAGTFGLMVEVPYWKEATRPSGSEQHSLKDVFGPAFAWSQEVVQMLDRFLPTLGSVGGTAAPRFFVALQDMREAAERRMRLFAAPPEVFLPEHLASAQRRVARFHLLRPVAMLSRLAALALDGNSADAHARKAYDESTNYLARAMAETDFAEGLEPVPLRDTVGLQVLAALTTAAALGQGTHRSTQSFSSSS